MYTPAHFSVTPPEALVHLIEANPLGALVVAGPHGLDANQIPFEFEARTGEHGVLRAHVARANPVWQEVRDGDAVLVIFRATDAYVSPNWYPSKHETHRQVPTWNYQVANVHGRIRVIDDEKFVRGVIARLTRTHEQRTHPDQAWRMGDAPHDYIDTLIKMIVGIEIEISRIDGKAKLSQNREVRDRLSAADALEARGDHAIARAMRQP